MLAGHNAQGKTMEHAFVTDLHRVTLSGNMCSMSSVMSKAPPTHAKYPGVNANYRIPPLCRTCASCMPSVFAGMYNFHPSLSACRKQPLPGSSACRLDLVPFGKCMACAALSLESPSLSTTRHDLRQPIDAGLLVKLKPGLPRACLLLAKCIDCALSLGSNTPNSA